MGSWFYRWEDGTVSFVSAPTKMDAVFLLDEVGAADPGRLESVREGFFVTYRPKKVADLDQELPWEEESHCDVVLSILDELHGKPAPEPTTRSGPETSEIGAPPITTRRPGELPGVSDAE